MLPLSSVLIAFAVSGQATRLGSASSDPLYMTERAAPAVSAAGQCKVYSDSTAHVLYQSCNGGAYTAIATAASIVGGAGITVSGSGPTVATASSEADFLAAGALTCGAGTQGKMQVHTTPLQYCDNSATPTLRKTAYSDDSGNATGVACAGSCVSDAEVDDNITASSYCALAGCAITGASSVVATDAIPFLVKRTSTSVVNTPVSTYEFYGITTGDMVDGFGPQINGYIRDSAAADNYIGSIAFRRAGADNTGDITLRTVATGSLTNSATFATAGSQILTPLTIGAAAGDVTTFNSAALTFANDTAVTLSGGANGINFDSNTLSINAADNRVGFGTATPSATVDVQGMIATGIQAVTCPDSADGNPGTLALDIQKVQVEISSDDADGCTVTVAETSAVAGAMVDIINVSAVAVTMPDVATVWDCDTPTLGTNDARRARYTSTGSLWVCIGVDN